jgi:hypothetical protein
VLERRREEATAPNLSVPGGGPILDYLQRGEYSPRWRLLELVAYINTNGRPSRRERSERRNSDVQGAGFCTIPYGIRTEFVYVGFWVFSYIYIYIYIYLTDVNLRLLSE